jgi:hypothetical protein
MPGFLSIAVTINLKQLARFFRERRSESDGELSQASLKTGIKIICVRERLFPEGAPRRIYRRKI